MIEVSHSSVGISTGGLGADGSDGKASGTTYAAFSPGSLIIRDQANQQQDVSELSRDVEHANQSISPIFDKAKEQQRLSRLRLIGDVVNQAVDITLTQGQIMANNAGIKEAGEWDGKEKRDVYWNRVKNTEAYKSVSDQYKAGGDLDRGVRAAAAAITALAGGDPAKALAAGAAPYMAGVVKGMTVGFDENPTAGQIAANAIGHAVLGGVVAELSGTNAAAGAIGAASGELAARAIREYLYPGVKTEDLKPEERTKISNLASLAGALAGGLSTETSSGVITAHDSSKNAVDNNDLLSPGMMSWGSGAVSLAKYEIEQGKTPEQVSESLRIYNRGTLSENQDPVRALLQAWGFFMVNALTLGGGSTVTGGAITVNGIIGGAANINNQVITMKPGEKISYTDALIATGVSAVTTGKSFLATQAWGMSGAYVGSKIKGDQDSTGAVTGAGVGNVAGATTSTIISGAAGTKLPKPAADMLGSTFGAAVSEGTGTVIQKAIDKKPQDQQGK